jgi:hypothetical protein
MIVNSFIFLHDRNVALVKRSTISGIGLNSTTFQPKLLHRIQSKTQLKDYSNSSFEGSSSRHQLNDLSEILDLNVSRFAEDFEASHLLGSGGFGRVYCVRNRLDGMEYAIKSIRLPKSDKVNKVFFLIHKKISFLTAYCRS